ncbi:hypothetical protein H4R35_002681 [Dimargaris xerosporica]|nr:hypothetical protein H4R35_002681 [Dimargaris xerosporica]
MDDSMLLPGDAEQSVDQHPSRWSKRATLKQWTQDVQERALSILRLSHVTSEGSSHASQDLDVSEWTNGDEDVNYFQSSIRSQKQTSRILHFAKVRLSIARSQKNSLETATALNPSVGPGILYNDNFKFLKDDTAPLLQPLDMSSPSSPLLVPALDRITQRKEWRQSPVTKWISSRSERAATADFPDASGNNADSPEDVAEAAFGQNFATTHAFTCRRLSASSMDQGHVIHPMQLVNRIVEASPRLSEDTNPSLDCLHAPGPMTGRSRGLSVGQHPVIHHHEMSSVERIHLANGWSSPPLRASDRPPNTPLPRSSLSTTRPSVPKKPSSALGTACLGTPPLRTKGPPISPPRRQHKRPQSSPPGRRLTSAKSFDALLSRPTRYISTPRFQLNSDRVSSARRLASDGSQPMNMSPLKPLHPRTTSMLAAPSALHRSFTGKPKSSIRLFRTDVRSGTQRSRRRRLFSKSSTKTTGALLRGVSFDIGHDDQRLNSAGEEGQSKPGKSFGTRMRSISTMMTRPLTWIGGQQREKAALTSGDTKPLLSPSPQLFPRLPDDHPKLSANTSDRVQSRWSKAPKLTRRLRARTFTYFRVSRWSRHPKRRNSDMDFMDRQVLHHSPPAPLEHHSPGYDPAIPHSATRRPRAKTLMDNAPTSAVHPKRWRLSSTGARREAHRPRPNYRKIDDRNAQVSSKSPRPKRFRANPIALLRKESWLKFKKRNTGLPSPAECGPVDYFDHLLAPMEPSIVTAASVRDPDWSYLLNNAHMPETPVKAKSSTLPRQSLERTESLCRASPASANVTIISAMSPLAFGNIFADLVTMSGNRTRSKTKATKAKGGKSATAVPALARPVQKRTQSSDTTSTLAPTTLPPSFSPLSGLPCPVVSRNSKITSSQEFRTLNQCLHAEAAISKNSPASHPKSDSPTLVRRSLRRLWPQKGPRHGMDEGSRAHLHQSPQRQSNRRYRDLKSIVGARSEDKVQYNKPWLSRVRLSHGDGLCGTTDSASDEDGVPIADLVAFIKNNRDIGQASPRQTAGPVTLGGLKHCPSRAERSLSIDSKLSENPFVRSPRATDAETATFVASTSAPTDQLPQLSPLNRHAWHQLVQPSTPLGEKINRQLKYTHVSSASASSSVDSSLSGASGSSYVLLDSPSSPVGRKKYPNMSPLVTIKSPTSRSTLQALATASPPPSTRVGTQVSSSTVATLASPTSGSPTLANAPNSHPLKSDRAAYFYPSRGAHPGMFSRQDLRP